jgi:sulfonate transport system permease protein
MVADTAATDRTGSEFAGLDALELGGAGRALGPLRRLWSTVWPKLLAAVAAILVWQLVVWSGWKPEYVLPGPLTVLGSLRDVVTQGDFGVAVVTTLRRAVAGFALATLIGFVLGVAVARVRVLRAALGSMITALQTMPSIAWFPLAILLYQLTESAILFVVILGAAPSIANGVISGVDYVPPVLVRVGQNIGARGIRLYRYVIAPASLPSIVAGLKQGWAFAWRSLMAGELLVTIANRPALGQLLDVYREQSDAAGLIAMMIVILTVGLVIDGLFGAADRAIRKRWGMAS